MGTDRSIEFEGHCLCGQGTFRIDDCEVDHAWPTATPQWYEPHILCPKCSERFSFQKLGNRFILVERSALREREQRKKAADEMTNTILADEEVRTTISRFESLLNAQRSVAAIYRLLSEAGLESCAEGTFRRHWTNSRTWVKQWAKPKTLAQIFQIVGVAPQRLTEMLKELQALEEYASQPPEPYGKAIHVLGA